MSLLDVNLASHPPLDLLELPAFRKALHRVTVEQYHRMGELGIVGERTELIRGFIVDKRSQSLLHCFVVRVLVEWLKTLGSGWLIREAKPVTTLNSEGGAANGPGPPLSEQWPV